MLRLPVKPVTSLNLIQCSGSRLIAIPLPRTQNRAGALTLTKHSVQGHSPIPSKSRVKANSFHETPQ